ncbi:MAG: helicase-related protein, partial [Acidobacteriota bacterium]
SSAAGARGANAVDARGDDDQIAARKLDAIIVFRRARSDVGPQATRRVRWHRVRFSEAEHRLLDALSAFERVVLGGAPDARREIALLLLSVFRKRALSTMGALDRSLQRRMSWLDENGPPADPWFQPLLRFDGPAPMEDDASVEDRAALAGDIGIRPDRERAWLRRLRILAQRATRDESKVTRLAALLSRSTEPVVIFTEFRHSLELIHARLAAIRSVATMHGGQSATERAGELARFLDTAPILIATDVAGQGLNLQRRARWVVSFELPWNPARLEQRIGRVDRIGQRRATHVTLLVGRHNAESQVLRRMATRVVNARRGFTADALGEMRVPRQVDVARAVFDHEVPPGSGPPPLASAASAAPPVAPSAPDDFLAPHALVCGSDERQIKLCRRFRRPAQAVARVLGRRRALAVTWRGPVESRGARVWTSTRGFPFLRQAGVGNSRVCDADEIAFVVVPILDGLGATVERHVFAHASSLTTHAAHRPALADALRAAATAHLRMRVKRIDRLAMTRIDREETIHRAIVGRLQRETAAESAQPMLFQWAKGGTGNAAAPEVAELAHDLEARIDEWRQAVGARVGAPEMLILFRRRR